MDMLDTAAPFEIKSDPGADDSDAANLVTKALDDFRASVDDRLAALETKSADTKLADRLKAVETRLSRPGAGVEIKSGAEAGEVERKAFGTYLRAGKEALGADEVKSLSVAGTAGTYIAPPQFANELLKYLIQFSPIRAYATKMQIQGTQLIFPRETGTLNASWVAEGAPRTGTTDTFEPVTITPFEIATYYDVSQALIEDNAFDLEGFLATRLGENFGRLEGQAFVKGTGVGQPMGILTSPQVSSIPSNQPEDVSLKDILALFHDIPTVWAQSGAFMMNRKTMGHLRAQIDSVGRPLFLDAITAGAPSTLLGRPIVECVDMPDIASGATPIVFGDLSAYRIADRVGYSTMRDPYSQAGVGNVRFWARKRVGGDITDGTRLLKLVVG